MNAKALVCSWEGAPRRDLETMLPILRINFCLNLIFLNFLNDYNPIVIPIFLYSKLIYFLSKKFQKKMQKQI